MKRRQLLAGAIVTTVTGFAGCSGSSDDSDPTDTPEDTPDETETSTTPTTTETTTSTSTTETSTTTEEEVAPSLDEFAYPEGASQDGIDSPQLYRAHELAITEAGSVTLTGELTRASNNFEETLALERRLSDDGVATTRQNTDGRTESLWSPSSDSAAYVRFNSGFNEGYRIDNIAPDPNQVAELRQFQQLLTGAEWGEALEVVSAGDEQYAVTYEATGIEDEQQLLRLQFGDSVTEFSATVAVSQAGYLQEISYDITTETPGGPRQRVVTLAVEAVGATTVEEPEWAETAREEGIQFDAGITEDGSAVELEMINGGEVPADARASLNDRNGRGDNTLSGPVTPGDSLFLAISDSNELLAGTDSPPEGGRELETPVFAVVRVRGFKLFEETL